MRPKIQLGLLLAAVAVASEPVMLDRIAVIVGKKAIKLSDIDRDLRITAFLNQAPLDFSPQERRQSAGRLVDQELIRKEIATGSYGRPAEIEGVRLAADLVRDRFHGADAEYRRSLERYGITNTQLESYLLWQTTALRFIDQRFKPAVFVSDDQVQQYCRQHQTELRKENPQADEEALQNKCRGILEGEQVNQDFEQWLERQHKNTPVKYMQEAFQ